MNRLFLDASGIKSSASAWQKTVAQQAAALPKKEYARLPKACRW